MSNYSSSTFLNPLSSTDRTIQIYNEDLVVTHTLSTFNIKNVFRVNNLIKVNLKSDRTITLDFNSKNEAILALPRLKSQIDQLNNLTPLRIDKDVEKYTIDRFGQYSNISGGYEYNCDTGNMFYHTTYSFSGLSQSFPVNIINLPDMDMVNVSLIIDQGIATYSPKSYRVEGITQSVKWELPGNTFSFMPNQTDIIDITFMRTGITSSVLLGNVRTFI